MKYTLTGACPRCGAPVYATEEDRPPETEEERLTARSRIRGLPGGKEILAKSLEEVITQVPASTLALLIGCEEARAPRVHFTCPCHETLPDMKPLEGMVEESTETGDRRTLARHRPREEQASEERAD